MDSSSPVARANSDEANKSGQDAQEIQNNWGFDDANNQQADPNMAIPLPYAGPMM